MRNLKRKVEELEREQEFQTWFLSSRFLESLSYQQLEEVIVFWRFPDPLPEPLPPGASELDGLDRKQLLKRWKESKRETARLMLEMKGRTPEELCFHNHHAHWPEQACDMKNCYKCRMEYLSKNMVSLTHEQPLNSASQPEPSRSNR